MTEMCQGNHSMTVLRVDIFGWYKITIIDYKKNTKVSRLDDLVAL